MECVISTKFKIQNLKIWLDFIIWNDYKKNIGNKK